MIIKLQNGDKLKIESDEKREARRKYNEHSLLSIGLKLKRNLNIAYNFLKEGPNATNFGNAISALFGGYSPENPDLHYGEAPGVGIKNFANLVKTARVAREFSDVLSKAPKTKEFIMPGLIGWAPKTKFKGYHASNENPFIPDFFREGWALKTHNAVKGIYIANGKVPGYGFLTKRKYVHPVETTFEKPQIQLGEVKGRTKNSIRNLVERDALEQGADGIIFKRIADNLMPNLFIAKTLNPDTKIINGPVNLFLNSKLDLNKYNRLSYLIGDDYGIWEETVPSYVNKRIEKLRTKLPNIFSDYKNSKYDDYFLSVGFTPKVLMRPGKNLKALLYETERRLNNVAGVDEDRNLALIYKGLDPYYLGYFDVEGTSGMHNVKRGISMIEPNPHTKMANDMMHEGISHGTDRFMPLSVIDQYQAWVDNIMNSPYIKDNTFKSGFRTYKINKGSDKWYEARATIGELRKIMYDKIAKLKGITISKETLPELRPEFEKQVDNMSLEDASKALKDLEAYGLLYGEVGPKTSPSFLRDFKTLLKFMPATVPFLIPRKEEKK